MKKTILTLVMMATALMALNVSAQPGEDGSPGHKGHGRDAPMVQHLVRAIHQNLELSDEQETVIRAIMQDLRTEMEPLMQEMQAGKQLLHEQIDFDTYDEAAIEAIAAQQGDLTTQKIIITSRAVSDVLAELTEEQRAELQALRDEHLAGRQQRQQQRRRDG